MLGGSAVHFSLAASFFAEVRVVGPVGDDFGERRVRRAARRAASITDDIEHVAGRQDVLLARRLRRTTSTSRTRDDTQLNVFGDFEPKLSEASRAADVLFLANIQPDLQREVREQCDERALRRAGLDEPVDRHRARLARARRSRRSTA